MALPPAVHIIDDDDAVRDSLAVLLEIRGVPVVTYGSAEAFLAALAEGAEGCVVTIQSDVDHPPPPDLLRCLLTCALGTGPAPSDLILSVEPRPSALLVSLVTLPGDPARAAALREALTGTSAVVEDGTESTWVEVSTHAAGVVVPPTAVPIDGDSAIGAPAAG